MFLVELGDKHISFNFEKKSNVTVVTCYAINIQNMLIKETLCCTKTNTNKKMMWPVISFCRYVNF